MDEDDDDGINDNNGINDDAMCLLIVGSFGVKDNIDVVIDCSPLMNGNGN